jgi:murein L,D-transpeptidase YafK
MHSGHTSDGGFLTRLRLQTAPSYTRRMFSAAGVNAVLLALATAAAPLAARAEGPLPTSALLTPSVEPALPMADRVVVQKSERKLQLLRNGEVLRTYKVALGLRPEGHKEYEGDFRTPEGQYRLSRRNPNSEYFLSIQIDYPNERDVKRARKLGQRPGGAIMIHGQPNVPRKPRDYYSNVDWTEGCIAVSNSDMVEIWLMTPPDTPIEIRP